MARADVVVYKCVVCGETYLKQQSLEAHLKKHRDIEWADFSVRLPREFVDRVKVVCKDHNMTTCHLVFTLLNAVLDGEKLGVVDLHRIMGANPLVVTLEQHFLGVPRSKKKYLAPAPEAVLTGESEPVAGFGSQGRRWRRKSLPPLDPNWLKHQLEV